MICHVTQVTYIKITIFGKNFFIYFQIYVPLFNSICPEVVETKDFYWIKPKTIKLVFVASLLSTQHQGVRAMTGWLEIRIMCLCGATCLSCSLHDILTNCSLPLNNNHAFNGFLLTLKLYTLQRFIQGIFQSLLFYFRIVALQFQRKSQKCKKKN